MTVTTAPGFKLERQDDENARILSGNTIVGTLNWTDSCWALVLPRSTQGVIAFPDCNEVEDMDLAFTRAIPSLVAAPVGLNFLLDPPTFVGITQGEQACWAYAVWKLVCQAAPAKRFSADMSEWKARDYQAAQAIYRRSVRKYGDCPPDHVAELKAAMTG